MSTSSSSSGSDSAASAPTSAPSIASTSTSDSAFPSSVSTSPTPASLPSQAPPATVTPASLRFHWTTYTLPESTQVDAGTPISASASTSSSSSFFVTLNTNIPTRTSETTPRTPSQSSPPAGPLAQTAVSSTALGEDGAHSVSVSVLGGPWSTPTIDQLADTDASKGSISDFSVTRNWAALASNKPEYHHIIPHSVVPITWDVGSAGRLPNQETPTSFPNPTSGGDSSNDGIASFKSKSSAIIGAVCGGVAFLTIILLLSLFFCRRRRRKGLSLPEDGLDRGWSYMVEMENHGAPIHDRDNPFDIHHNRNLGPHTISPPPELPPRPRTSNPNPFVSPDDPSISRRNTSSSISSSIHFASRSSTPGMPEPESLVSSSFKYNLSYHPRNAIQQPSLMTVVDLIRGQKRARDASVDTEPGWDFGHETRTID